MPGGTAHRAMGDVETTVNLLLLPDAAGHAHLRHLILRKLPEVQPCPKVSAPS